MSLIGDYFKLLPLGLKNFPQVVEGIVNSVKSQYGYLPKEEQDEIIRRRGICHLCPYMSKNTEGYESDRADEHCSLCFCNISLKTACLECRCGIEVYNQQNPDNKMELKWTNHK